jgi:hypothetical protein
MPPLRLGGPNKGRIPVAAGRPLVTGSKQGGGPLVRVCIITASSRFWGNKTSSICSAWSN